VRDTREGVEVNAVSGAAETLLWCNIAGKGEDIETEGEEDSKDGGRT